MDVVQTGPDGMLIAECLEATQHGESTVRSANRHSRFISPVGQPSPLSWKGHEMFKLQAQALIDARLSFGATSPFPQDVVLVNEFVKGEIFNTVMRVLLTF